MNCFQITLINTHLPMMSIIFLCFVQFLQSNNLIFPPPSLLSKHQKLKNQGASDIFL